MIRRKTGDFGPIDGVWATILGDSDRYGLFCAGFSGNPFHRDESLEGDSARGRRGRGFFFPASYVPGLSGDDGGIPSRTTSGEGDFRSRPKPCSRAGLRSSTSRSNCATNPPRPSFARFGRRMGKPRRAFARPPVRPIFSRPSTFARRGGSPPRRFARASPITRDGRFGPARAGQASRMAEISSIFPAFGIGWRAMAFWGRILPGISTACMPILWVKTTLPFSSGRAKPPFFYP